MRDLHEYLCSTEKTSWCKEALSALLPRLSSGYSIEPSVNSSLHWQLQTPTCRINPYANVIIKQEIKMEGASVFDSDVSPTDAWCRF